MNAAASDLHLTLPWLCLASHLQFEPPHPLLHPYAAAVPVACPGPVGSGGRRERGHGGGSLRAWRGD